MRKRGGPRILRSVEAIWWQMWLAGFDLNEAATKAGISPRLALCWLEQSGGLAPDIVIDPEVEVEAIVGGRGLRRRSQDLTYAERQTIETMLRTSHPFGRARRCKSGTSLRAIARHLGRCHTAVIREVNRNPRRCSGSVASGDRAGDYDAHLAQSVYEHEARRPQTRKLAANPELAALVAAWMGEDGRYCSPEQISARLKLDFPDRPEMWVSPETIYQSLYVQGRGGLRSDLHRCLRTGRARRVPNARSRSRSSRAATRIPDLVSISQRPAEVEDRAVPGHWEGDLVVGKDNASAVGTLVERTTGFVVLLHLPGRHGAVEVRDAMVAAVATLPAQLWKSLTWDRGLEMARHVEISTATDLAIYFADPYSPWQRGSNENTNGLLRQYFPKGTDLSVHSAQDLERVAAAMNARPRKRHEFATPAEVLAGVLSGA